VDGGCSDLAERIGSFSKNPGREVTSTQSDVKTSALVSSSDEMKAVFLPNRFGGQMDDRFE